VTRADIVTQRMSASLIFLDQGYDIHVAEAEAAPLQARRQLWAMAG